MQILDAKAGFLVNGCITVSATVLVLEESTQFTRDSDSAAAGEESLRYAQLCHTARHETSMMQTVALYIPSRAFLVFVASCSPQTRIRMSWQSCLGKTGAQPIVPAQSSSCGDWHA